MRGSEIGRLGIVGTGVMGRGIAQLAATAGLETVLFDARPRAVDDAVADIRRILRRQVEKGRMTVDAVEAALGRLKPVSLLTELSGCDAVIEAIVEDLAAKRTLIDELETILADTALIASNTSSFLIAELAAAARVPGRVLGLHFFNPAPLMKLVEVAGGPRTSAAALDRGVKLAETLERVPVRVADVAGFLVNQLGRGYVLEAARIAETGAADFATIDRILTETLGFPMGPFALMDLTGLDVTYPASASIYEENGREPRYCPPGLLRRRYKAGLFGRKAGAGFYRYDVSGQPDTGPAPPWPAAADAPFFLLTRGDLADRVLADRLDTAGVAVETGDRPSDLATVLVPLLGESALALCEAHSIDPRRAVGIDALCIEAPHATLVATPITDPGRVAALAEALPVSASLCGDQAGTVCQRIILQLALIAGDLIGRGVAEPDDADRAAGLALGHKEGPLARVWRLGAARIEQVRTAIYAETGDARFRPSPWLSQQCRLRRAGDPEDDAE